MIVGIKLIKSCLFLTNPETPVNNFASYDITAQSPNANKNIPIVLFAKNPIPAIPIKIPARIPLLRTENNSFILFSF